MLNNIIHVRIAKPRRHTHSGWMATSRPASVRLTCLLCLLVIKPKERLVLHNPASRHVITVLEGFLNELEPASTAALHADASICRSCVRSLEKFLRLKKDLAMIEEDIRLKMDRLGAKHGLRRREAGLGQVAVQRTPEKRSADTAELGTSLASYKRRKYDTPIRNMFERMVPTGSSPVVAVSIILKLTYIPLFRTVHVCIYLIRFS